MPEHFKGRKKPQQYMLPIAVIVLLLMIAYQVYKGVYFKKIGIQDWFEIEFEQPISKPQATLRGKTVYIHISSESQRNDANAFLKRLTDNSAKVYGVTNLVEQKKVSPENVEHSFPEENMQIRYYYLNDLEAAKSIQELSQRNNVILDNHTEDPNKLSEGFLEVWYPWFKR